MAPQTNQSQTSDPYSHEYLPNNIPGEVGEIVHSQLAEAGAGLQLLKSVIPDTYGAELRSLETPKVAEVTPQQEVAEQPVGTDTYAAVASQEVAQKVEVSPVLNANIDLATAQQNVANALGGPEEPTQIGDDFTLAA